MKSLVALVLAFIACMFGLPQAGAAPSVPTHAPVIAYDTTHELVAGAHTVSERGPPAHADGFTVYDAADGWSPRASRHQLDVAAARNYTNNYVVPLAQAVRATGTTWEHAQADGGGLSSLGRSGVAANGGVKAIEASTRVAPWAGSSLSRLSTGGEKMYRVWGGGADQAGAWLTPIRPSSAAAAREGLALPAENAATYVSEVTLPAGVRMQVGTAGPAFGQPGGWAQAQLLERIPLSSFGKGELLP